MLLLVRRISRVRVYDIRPDAARVFGIENGPRLGVDIEPVNSLDDALGGADIVVTATWANKPFLQAGMIGPGTHVTTLGADQPSKAEVSADLLRSSLFVCDDRELAVSMGAVGGAGVGPEVIDAALGEVIAGILPGRIVGADKGGDQELDPEILQRARIFVDDIRQYRTDGEINVPLCQGRVWRSASGSRRR
jgi:ornithine cyclodeaminase